MHSGDTCYHTILQSYITFMFKLRNGLNLYSLLTHFNQLDVLKEEGYQIITDISVSLLG